MIKEETARRYSPSLLVRARGGDELTVGKFLDTLSRGCGCGPSRFGLGLNSALKSALSKPSSNSCINPFSSDSTSPSYRSRNTVLGTRSGKKESSKSLYRVMDSISDTSNIHRGTPFLAQDCRYKEEILSESVDDERRDKIISAFSALVSGENLRLVRFEME